MPSVYSVQVETFQSFVDGAINGAIQDHWHEISPLKDPPPFDPDTDVYFAAEENGALLVMVLRCDDAFAGWFLGFITPALHHRGLLTCTGDTFFVLPEFRGNLLAGRRLLRAVEAELRLRGVRRWFVGTTLRKDIGRLFESQHFTPVETYYSKRLGD